MGHDPRKLLQDVLDAAELIQEFAEGFDLASMDRDARTRLAIERQFITIGEALSVFRNAEPELAEEIREVHAVIGFRNVLVHGYSIIEVETVWRSVLDDLPILVQDVTSLLNRLGDDGGVEYPQPR